MTGTSALRRCELIPLSAQLTGRLAHRSRGGVAVGCKGGGARLTLQAVSMPMMTTAAPFTGLSGEILT